MAPRTVRHYCAADAAAAAWARPEPLRPPPPARLHPWRLPRVAACARAVLAMGGGWHSGARAHDLGSEELTELNQAQPGVVRCATPGGRAVGGGFCAGGWCRRLR
eukprot:4232145-Prymnesium_polylepis.1